MGNTRSKLSPAGDDHAPPTETPPHEELPRPSFGPALFLGQAVMSAWNSDTVIHGNGTSVASPNSFSSKSDRFSPKLVEIHPNVDAGVLSPPPSLTPSPGGKSGRVIERLQTENERLKRELNVERRQKEEMTKSLAICKGTEETLRERVNNLHLCQETDQKSLERKDRKIQELKKALEAETTRRAKAESSVSEMAHQLDQTHTDAHQKIAEATSYRKMAEVNAETLKSGFHGLREEVEKATRDFSQLRKEKEENASHLRSLEVVLDQNSKEMADKDHLVAQLQKQMEEYRQAVDSQVAELVAEHAQMKAHAEASDQATDRFHSDMVETANKMKWTMNMDRHFREE